jgi:F0F1-type ATP synthase alpha subunit
MNQVGKTNKPAKLLVADIKTGKTLYKGETVINKKNSKSFELYIDDLEIK